MISTAAAIFYSQSLLGMTNTNKINMCTFTKTPYKIQIVIEIMRCTKSNESNELRCKCR